ncbi:phospholipase A-2-activating protein [Nematocida sp. AWRm77]|nr:phospholipase A-2-activating protein [Nematocida sp. AWRm77]
MVKIELIKKVHDKDIKACAVHQGLVFTAGRDGRVCVLKEDTLELLHKTESLGSFANSLCVSGEQLYVGMQSGEVCIFHIRQGQLENKTKTKKHKENVCSLRAYKDTVVSTSWDGRVGIWKDGELVDMVETEKTLWAAEILHNEKETLVAGCTDGSLVYLDRHGGKYTPSKGLAIHSSCIRDFVVEDGRIVSLSNSGMVLATDYSGRVLQRKDLDSISFKITEWKETGQYMVASDEGVVRVLDRDLSVLCTITLPVLSCWQAVHTSTRMLVCASDGRVFVFGEEGSPSAEEELGRLQEELAAGKAAGAEGEGSAEKAEPKYKVEDGKVYEKKGDSWELYGDALGKEKKDHTIDIELGTQVFKLSFNKTDDYTEVAQSFVKEHGLGVEYIPEIVEFLETNFKQKKQRNTSEYVVYSTISVEGVRKKLAGFQHVSTVIGFIEEIEGGSLSSGSTLFKEKASEVEVVLSEWLEEGGEKFPVLDCYKYLVAKHVSFDFMFMKSLNVLDSKKDALMYVRLATNLLAFSPECKKYFVETVGKIFDKNLVSDENIRHYKKNLYLSDE